MRLVVFESFKSDALAQLREGEMSDMLHGVLCMPPELWTGTELDKAQRYSRYLQASRRIEDDEREIERLRLIEAAARNLVAQKGRHNAEIAYNRLVDAMHITPEFTARPKAVRWNE